MKKKVLLSVRFRIYEKEKQKIHANMNSKKV